MTEASKVETMRWRHNQLEMIDQRVLPMRFEYLSYANADEVAQGIRSMVVRGAPAIGVAGAMGVALAARNAAAATGSRAAFDAEMARAMAADVASGPTATASKRWTPRMTFSVIAPPSARPKAPAGPETTRSEPLTGSDVRR